MKLPLAVRRLWACLPPHTWVQVYTVILTLLLLFLALACLIDMLKGALP